MREAITPLPQYAFMAWCLVKKHRNNFTFASPVIKHITPWKLMGSIHNLCTRRRWVPNSCSCRFTPGESP